MNKLFSFLFKQSAREPETKSRYVEGLLAYEKFVEAEKRFVYKGEIINANEALLLLDKAIECGVTQAYSGRAFTLQGLEFHYDAIDDFNKAIEYSKNDANLYFGRGHSRKIIADYESAVSDLRIAVELIKEDNELNNIYIEQSKKAGQVSPETLYKLALKDALGRIDKCKREPYAQMYEKMKNKIVRRIVEPSVVHNENEIS